MNFISKGIFAALTLVAFTSFASAESVTLCTGKVGGGYDSLTKEIGNEFTRQGHTVKILNLGGSEGQESQEVRRALERWTSLDV